MSPGRLPPDEQLWIDIPSHTDARGGISFVEAGRDVPFAFKRAYYLYDVGSSSRGAHAHRALHQLFLAVHGSFVLHLDDATRRVNLRLDNPARGVVVPPMVWRDLDTFSPGAVCLVLASEWYDEADYIRNYDDFTRAAVRP